MLTTRIIPCLDVRGSRVVKGIKFQGLRDVGDPVERSIEYEKQGADELVMLDVSATPEERDTAFDTVASIRKALSIPLTVGGGVRRVEDASRLLDSGADKVSMNTAAVENPELIGQVASLFGRQCSILALDAARRDPDNPSDGWIVVTHSGKNRWEKDAVDWAVEATERGAGEILLTSWDRDGTRSGYDLELLTAVSNRVEVPVIASGGASSALHMVEAVRAGASALLAASIFHENQLTVASLKESISEYGVEVRR